MLKVENIGVFNIGGAIRGMRNPLESWGKSDTEGDSVGPSDLILAKKLVLAGPDHSKFMRQIFVSMDITAPMSWWWDFDTYKVATTKNSTSRMHKLGSRLLTYDDFSWDNEEGKVEVGYYRETWLRYLNARIEEFQKTKDMDLWREILMDLPQSYNFLATWTGSYQNLRNIYFARKSHKQKEFRDFCSNTIEKLTCSELITAN